MHSTTNYASQEVGPTKECGFRLNGGGTNVGSVERSSRYFLLLFTLLLALGVTSLLLLLASGHAVIASTNDSSNLKFDQALQEALNGAQKDDQLRVVIHMQATADDQFSDLPVNIQERRSAVVERLQMSAAQSQSAIQLELQQRANEGEVSFYRSLWIINGIQLAANPSAIRALAARPDVAQISLDASVQLLNPMTPTISTAKMGPTSSYEPGQDKLWHIERIRAQHAWAGLGISGTNVTVATMDTGVDWLHPALAGTYAGITQNDSIDHTLAWFDAVDGTPEPFDPNGHGTHVLGTAVGRTGIGVAPGSRWMAVRILGPDGSGYIGDIHAGFQWLLAPGGDPSLAPDIVNGSWSGPPSLVDFSQDIQALHAASVITVFAAGNAGPFEGSIRAPANYPGVIAVGATDDNENVAWFSSRGPSNLTSQVKPTIVAPGMHILSSLPGDNYGFFNGTSMASPIVSGIYALLLSAGANPGVATTALTTTASPAGAPSPNADSGWGRADAYGSLAAIVSAGHLLGNVKGDGLPLAGAVITVTTPEGVDLGFTSMPDGSFAADLISGTYGLSISAYGYQAFMDSAVVMPSEPETSYNVDLARLPFGEVEGQMVDKATGSPVAGTVRVTGSPISVSVTDNGSYSMELPAGDYEIVAWAGGHRLGRHQLTITAGLTTSHDFYLDAGPRILLVDSGPWYGGSHITEYSDALQQNDFAFSTHAIRDPYSDVPTVEMLASFDILVWSAPRDSPGYIAAGDSLSAYLEAGGNLLISGQNVAAYDGAGLIPQEWWLQLGGVFIGKAELPFAIRGMPGSVFEGVEAQVSELDGFGDPVLPDTSALAGNSLTEIGITYGDGGAASLLAATCQPFRISYFGFGLEDISDLETQANLIDSAFNYFAEPEIETGLLFANSKIDDLVAPGSVQTYQIQLLNLSETLTDTFSLEFVGSQWPSTVVTKTVEVGPCETGASAIEIEIPSETPRDTVEEFSLLATSSNDPAYQQALDIRLKTPGHILLVDDDRWYDQSEIFKGAMNDAGLSFDFWDTDRPGNNTESPSAALLATYDFVLWYTGYDWFRPITKQESEMLADYVQQGGRLFLTSQDYMYYHVDDRLTRDYLGVRQYVESITPTLAFGGDPPTPFYDIGGPQELQFGLYQNHADGLVPSTGSAVSLWNEHGYAAGVATSGTDWRTVFWAIPLETLPKPVHAKAMNRITGWLGDLGDTTFVVDDRSGPVWVTRSYTLTLRYSPTGPGSMVHVTNTLPLTIDIDGTSITGGALYEESTRQLVWSGHLDPGQEHVISYHATLPPNTPEGSLLVNPIAIYYEDHDLRFEREAKTWVSLPDTTLSQISASPNLVGPGQLVTVELRLLNAIGESGYISASLPLPAALTALTGTLSATHGEVKLRDNLLLWHGWLGPNKEITTTLVMTAPMSVTPAWLPLTARIDDGISTPVIVSTLLAYQPFAWYQPIFFR